MLYGYLDPGSGSFLFQLIIASLITSLFFVKQAWRRAREIFRRIFSHWKPDGRARR